MISLKCFWLINLHINMTKIIEIIISLNKHQKWCFNVLEVIKAWELQNKYNHQAQMMISWREYIPINTFYNLLISFKSLTFSLFHIFQKKYPLSVSILLCMFSLVLFNLLILYSASSDLFNWLISLFTADLDYEKWRDNTFKETF